MVGSEHVAICQDSNLVDLEAAPSKARPIINALEYMVLSYDVCI